MKNILTLFITLLVAISGFAASRIVRAFAIGNNFSENAIETKLDDLAKVQGDVYKDANMPIALRVHDLCSRMTLKEKVMQLNQYTLGRNTIENNKGVEVKDIPAEIGSLIYFGTDPELRNRMQRHAVEDSRLGIPILFAHDVIHGFRTIFPIPLAQACSFNPSLVKQSCAVAAQESRMSGVDWTFSPMIDVARDPRWGRVAEGYGEDAYLAGVMGAAAVAGYQGKSLAEPGTMAACLKHYVGYGASEAGRDYVYTEISDQTLWDTYLPPYRAALRIHPATVMSSFNNFSGCPVTSSHHLLTEVLKQQLGFEGFVVSDWGAIMQLKDQSAAADLKQAAQKSFSAGVDMDMMSHAYDSYLAELVKEGKVSEDLLDEAVCRVLKLKFELGLFENPYTPQPSDDSRFLRESSLMTAEQLAEESMVLLKNDSNLLPLKAPKTIALIGPLADADADLLGCWYGHGDKRDVTTIFSAIRKTFSDTSKVLYARGCDFDGSDESDFANAVSIARKADVVVLCLGEQRGWSGENASRASIALPDIQLHLMQAIAQTDRKIVLVLSNGRPLQLDRMAPMADAVIEMWQPGIAGGTPLARILKGEVNPSGRLAMTFPYSTGQIPIYYNRRPSARPHQGFYQDMTSEPLYPFGHGLSYTHFSYAQPLVSTTHLEPYDTFTVEVTVTNDGPYDGSETVLGYVSCLSADITRPVKELRFFDKGFIKSGSSKTFRFHLQAMRDLGFVDSKGKAILAPGTYRITIGDKETQLVVTE